jgi:acetyl/propionyl-CoA carboxylase alpha subunit
MLSIGFPVLIKASAGGGGRVRSGPTTPDRRADGRAG